MNPTTAPDLTYADTRQSPLTYDDLQHAHHLLTNQTPPEPENPTELYIPNDFTDSNFDVMLIGATEFINLGLVRDLQVEFKKPHQEFTAFGETRYIPEPSTTTLTITILLTNSHKLQLFQDIITTFKINGQPMKGLVTGYDLNMEAGSLYELKLQIELLHRFPIPDQELQAPNQDFNEELL